MNPKFWHQKNKILILAASGLLLVAAIACIAIWQGWFVPPVMTLQVGLPGAAASNSAEFRVDETKADALAARLRKLLQSAGTGLLASRYQLAGRFDQPAAVLSGDYLATDQLLYGQYLLEQDRSEEFQNWWDDFSTAFLTADGLVRTRTNLQDSSVRSAADFWRVNLSTLRLLAQSCSRWPSASRLDTLQRLSGQLLDLAGQGLETDFSALVPTPRPLPDPAATPTPRPTASPAVSCAWRQSTFFACSSWPYSIFGGRPFMTDICQLSRTAISAMICRFTPWVMKNRGRHI
jgi:hypothetical protein